MKPRTLPLPLPIKLQFMTVDLDGQDTPDARRWTLGPTWYQDNATLYDLSPYFESDSASLDPATILDQARRWAADVIHSTSDMVVTGWQSDGITPILSVTRHIAIIHTGGEALRFTISSARRSAIITALTDADAVLRLPSEGNTNVNMDPNGIEESIYIPVRSIGSIRMISHNKQVTNA